MTLPKLPKFEILKIKKGKRSWELREILKEETSIPDLILLGKTWRLVEYKEKDGRYWHRCLSSKGILLPLPIKDKKVPKYAELSK